MKVLVVGATGGSGRQAVAELLERGHEVTAFARRPDRLGAEAAGAHLVAGDATDPEAVAAAVAGQDAVVVALGISEAPLRVRLRGAKATTDDVRSVGTIAVIEAMRHHGVRRLVVLSSYGVGASRDRLGAVDRLLFWLLIRPQIEDSERQESAVRASGLDWVIVQPVHLTDGSEGGRPFASPDGEVRSRKVTRRQVATVLVDAADRAQPSRRTVAVSADPAVVRTPVAAGAR